MPAQCLSFDEGNFAGVKNIFFFTRLFLFSAVICLYGKAQEIPFLKQNDTSWADSVLNTLTPDQRIGQLFMVAAYSENWSDTVQIKHLIDSCGIGGLIFFQGGPVRQAQLTNYYQSVSKVKLLIAMDAEWGLNMRLDSTVRFPRQMTLGSLPPEADSLIYLMGKEIARQCKLLGVHVNLAPVADINNNPLNPVISSRSFGEDKNRVARKVVLYMRGLQDGGVLACAKHFPGHGDTDTDSHVSLPSILHSKERMDSIELHPFKQLIKNGVGGIMVAHLYIPAYDTMQNTASTLSEKVVTGLLKNEMKFSGLVFTDALNMKGVSDFFNPGEVDVKALLAGNDILLFSENVPKAIEEIKNAIARGEISQEEIDMRCKKILLAKQWCGLNQYSPIHIERLRAELNSYMSTYLNILISENSLVVLRNKNNLLPLLEPDTLRIASVSIGMKTNNECNDMLNYYFPVKHFAFSAIASDADKNNLFEKLKDFNLIIVNVAGTYNPGNNFGISKSTVDFVIALSQKTKVILNLAANPYALKLFNAADSVDAIILSHENHPYLLNLSAQLIAGGISSKGTMPVTASQKFLSNAGIRTGVPIRFKYTIPEEAGINSKKLEKIDSLMNSAISDKAFPGGVVLFAKNRKIFYYKAFGYHTYENKRSVKTDDIYDLASITKIAATTPCVMKLAAQKKINADDYLCYHLPELEGSNKMNLPIRDVMTHQAGLHDWFPFYLHTIQKGEYRAGIYSKVKNENYPYRVANKLYISKSYPDTIWKKIIESPLYEKAEYKYSDLGFLLMGKIVERESGMPLNEFAEKNFYQSLGLPTMTFRPREKFNLRKIVPTEYDVKFRRQLVHGDVHDPAAAMLGGVAGHAGLFSNASDLAVMMQMFLQGGEYGGGRYLDTAIINEFTRCAFCPDNRRGLGFDKPEKNPKKEKNICNCISASSFGHQGFTGTATWADPEKNLVYVFLSNRVYPDAENNKITKLGIRSALLNIVYDAMQ